MAERKKRDTQLTHALRLATSLLKDRFPVGVDPEPVDDCDLLQELMTDLRDALQAAEAAYAENCLFAKPTPTEDTQ